VLRTKQDNLRAELRAESASGALGFSVTQSQPGNASEVPAAKKMALFHNLMQRLFETEQRRQHYDLGVGPYPEMFDRLVSDAAASKQWDGQSGRPLRGSTNAFVKHLLNARGAYSELDEAVKPLGYRVGVSGVEHVVIAPVGQLSAERRAKLPRTEPSTRLPSSASVYFSLDKQE
jgi:hypothetical protein